MKQGMHLLLVGAVAVLGAEDARAPVISLDFGSKPIKYARVVCGKAGKCPSEEDGFAQKLDKHEVRCCSDTKLHKKRWLKKKGCSVFGETDVPKCYSKQTWYQAMTICEKQGARLCTAQELVDDCTAGTGCGHDRQLVWSSDEKVGVNPLTQTLTPYCKTLDEAGTKRVCDRAVCHSDAIWKTVGGSAGCVTNHGIDSKAQEHKKTFARKCDVFSNSKKCPLPQPSAFDHKQGNKLDKQIVTTYTLYIKSDPHKKPLLYKQEVDKVDYKQRGEYIVSYDVKDAHGNEAETMHFVVVMQDHVPPTLKVPQPSDIEAHGNGMEIFKLDMSDTTAFDRYDKNVLDTVVTTHKCDHRTKESTKLSSDLSLNIDTSELGTHSIKFDVHDFANIFGTDNKDNEASKTISFTVADTLAPKIYCKPVDVVTTGGTFPADLDSMSSHKVDNTGECAQTCFQQSWNRKPSDASCEFFQYAEGVCTLYGANAKEHYGKGALSSMQGVVPTCDTTSYVSCPNTYTDGGAVCIDLHDSYVSDGIFSDSALLPESSSNVDAGEPGKYTVKYTCADAEGHKTQQSRTVVVTDTTAPVLQINGDYSLTYQMEYGSAKNSKFVKNMLHHDEDGANEEVQFDYKHGYTWGDNKHGDFTNMGRHPNKGNGYTCRDECTNAGSHISHRVTTAVYAGNCNGKYACLDEKGHWTECDGGDDNYEVTTEDVLMPGVWAIKYSCSDESGNSMSRCRTVYNNVGSADEGRFSKVSKPIEVGLSLDWHHKQCLPTKSDFKNYVGTVLRTSLGEFYSSVQRVQVEMNKLNLQVAMTVDTSDKSAVAQIKHLVKNMVVFTLAKQYVDGSCGVSSLKLRDDKDERFKKQPLPIDCSVAAWSEWSKCSQQCGAGVSQRTRQIKTSPAFGGKPCTSLNQVKNCWDKKCDAKCPSSWFKWGPCTKTCGGGSQKREAVNLSAQKKCAFAQQRACNDKPCPIDCTTTRWSTWSQCTKACAGGASYRHRHVIQKARNGGTPCRGILTAKRVCNSEACPSDCTVGDWGDWSTCSQKCGGGVQSRNRKVVFKATNGGAQCPPLKTIRNCNVYACPIFCDTLWHDWGACPVKCGRGIKVRKVKVYKEAPKGEQFSCPTIRESVCGYAPCKVDCTVSKWSKWRGCTKSCGTGSKIRRRRVIQQPLHGGKCPELEESRWCNVKPCPQNCIMSDWTPKSRCSSNCGGGVQTRTRSVLQDAKHGAPQCPTEIQVLPCNTRPCAVDCNFKWGSWTTCSTTCGAGIQSRIIKVLEEAKHGGSDCPLSQTRACQAEPCPIDCVLTEWSDWSDCDQSCGAGKMQRTRKIASSPKFGGRTCDPETQKAPCNKGACPVHCKMSRWSSWSECSEKCGGDGFGGVQRRSRTVARRPTAGGKRCGPRVQSKACNVGPCSIHCSYKWKPWSKCSTTCGSGISTSAISINHHAHYGGTKCPKNRDRICNRKPCPEACQVSEWSEWRGCTRTCAGGNKKRTRYITSEAKYGGAACPHLQQVQSCNSEKCPIDCVVSNWRSFGECSEVCGGGVRTRRRAVLLRAHFGGMPCESKLHTQACNTKPCPVHCKYTTAKAWSACSKSCGGGVSIKKLTIHVAARFGGNACPVQQERMCNQQTCPIDCQLGAWTEWSICSKSCGRGQQKRTRLTRIEPSLGGIKCQPSVHIEVCNTAKCPVDCVVGEFGVWSKCSTQCGEGVQTRSRKIATHMAYDGERCPPLTDTQDCTVKACNPGCRWDVWGTCSVSCGNGVQTRNVDRGVSRDWECRPEQRVCTQQPCPVDCEVGRWTKWTSCSTTCGKGFRKRTRVVMKGEEVGGTRCPTLAQTKPCDSKPCARHCIMSIPSEWTACTKTCGTGSRTRTRSVVQNAAHGGKACPPEDEVTKCATEVCPVDCKVSKWSKFGTCSSKCGGGVRSRTRTVVQDGSDLGKPCPALEEIVACNKRACGNCDYPFEAWGECSITCGGGMQTRHIKRSLLKKVAHTTNCPVTEERPCSSRSCPTDCVWGTWTGFSTCSKSCGGGSQTKTRKAVVPAKFGGRPCYGRVEQSKSCSSFACPQDCVVSKWSKWSTCSKTCGIGGSHERARSIVTEAALGGASCPALVQSAPCNTAKCPVDCKLGTKYGKWSECSKTCAGGVRSRSLKMIRKAAFGGRACEEDTQQETCKTQACPLDCKMSKWDAWSDCDTTCGGGHQLRMRAVQLSEKHGGKACPHIEEVRFCNAQTCPVSCVLSGWSTWSVCTHSCGGGTKERARSVDVQPINGGKACKALSQTRICNTMKCAMDCILDDTDFGWTDCDRSCGTGYRHKSRKVSTKARHGGKVCPPQRQEKQCNTQPCSSDCVVSGFGAWSQCSASCNGGSSHRYRSRLEPNTFGGEPCPDLHQVRLCNAHACPADCGVSGWSKYSACSVTCGGKGIRVRTRTIVQAASFTGRKCPALTEGHECNDGPCAIHCQVTAFNGWSTCNKSCGGGSQSRSRKVTNRPKHSGYTCPALQESQPCNVHNCPVDCFASEWGQWGACSVTCGTGEHTATRTIKTRAAHGGKSCGALKKAFTCNLPECPVDCQLSNWRVWDECTMTCGGGKQWHVRSVEQTPAFGGLACGNLQEQRDCKKQACPIDCVVDEFTRWSECSTSCGGGSQTRSRVVKRFADFGGKECPAREEQRVCNSITCPVDCILSGWSSHTPCTFTCGEGKQTRFRTVKRLPESGGKSCGPTKELTDCNNSMCPSDCKVAPWGKYSPCDKSCGVGSKTRIRQLISLNSGGGERCPALSETLKCSHNDVCPVNCLTSRWSPWFACSKTCGGGLRTRVRKLLKRATHIKSVCPKLKDVEKCNDAPCPVHCKLSKWSAWGACNVKCGGGVQARDRVLQRGPKYGGKACGSLFEARECNSQFCSIDCKVHPWDRWTSCSKSCGQGKRTRSRSVDIKPAYGGKKCPKRHLQTLCNERWCPQDCQVSNWMPYQACTQSCGGGIHQRKRLLIIPASHGGRACPHMSESEECEAHACPVDCVVHPFGEWSTCSVSCGSGVQHRSRQIDHHALYGGKPCPTLESSRTCSTQPCPIDCELSPLDQWSKCTKSCTEMGTTPGSRSRERSIKISPAFGGRKCSPLSEQEVCNSHVCPMDCKVSRWDNWMPCTETCGGSGYRFKYRQVLTVPSGTGKPCPYLSKSEKCFLGPCPIHCELSKWSKWSKCSRSCGSGTTKRSRKLIHEAEHGGTCPVMAQSAQCNTEACPIDCGMSKWGDFTQCSTTCGIGYRTRSRTPIVYPMYGGKRCPTHTQKHRCNTQNCPIDCLVHEYGSWSTCTKSCGSTGIQLRKRTIWRQNVYGGKPCPSLTEERACNSFSCPVDCEVRSIRNGLSVDWSSWGLCSRSCGIGMRKRTRNVVTEAAHGGVPCPSLEMSEPCNINACPVDCLVTSWGAGGGWSSCDRSCGAGDRKRFRSIAIAPTTGGKRCPHLTEQQSCQHIAVPCPVDCEVGYFGNFSECSHSCGSHGTKTRVRAVTKEPIFGGNPCPSLSETISCSQWKCPINCKVSKWGSFSKCSKTCGGGVRYRTRTIKHQAKNYFACPGLKESEPCSEHVCPIDCKLGKWTQWSKCSKSCGKGYMLRTRKIVVSPQYGGLDCIHTDWNKPCNTKPCPVDCQLSAWKDWSKCSHTCGDGQQQRYRHTTVATEFGGKECPPTFETKRCNSWVCPVDCMTTEFGAWSACDATCGPTGLAKRYRSIVRPMEAGGRACTTANTEYKKCNRLACPIDCAQEPWNSWTTCSHSCGLGHRRRTRKIKQHARNGGVPCGPAQHVEICNAQRCSEDCKMSQWSRFGECSKKCGRGSRTRTRTILGDHKYGGAHCGVTHHVSSCYEEPCPVHCEVSEWSAFGECSEVCGTGYKVASRAVITPPSFGGNACPVLEKYDTCMEKMWCPHDCQWEWTPWSECTRSCDAGIQHRDLTILAKPVNGGKQCPEVLSRTCNTQACPTPAPTGRHSSVPTKVPTTMPTFVSGPVLDLLGGEILYLDASTNGFKDPGATCIDSEDGDISAEINVAGHVDSWDSGVYTLRYSCCNRHSNCAHNALRVVIVKDRTCPVCSFHPFMGFHGDDITVEASFPYAEPGGLTCQDNSRSEGELLNTTETSCTAKAPAACIGGIPDVETKGEYYITYRVQDANGHWNDDPSCGNVQPLVRTVTVADTLKPVIALKYKQQGKASRKTPYFGYYGSGKETSGITFQTNLAHKKFSEEKASWKPASLAPSMTLMVEEVASLHRTWLLAAAVSAIGGVALVGLAAQRSSEARLATIV